MTSGGFRLGWSIAHDALFPVDRRDRIQPPPRRFDDPLDTRRVEDRRGGQRGPRIRRRRERGGVERHAEAAAARLALERQRNGDAGARDGQRRLLGEDSVPRGEGNGRARAARGRETRGDERASQPRRDRRGEEPPEDEPVAGEGRSHGRGRAELGRRAQNRTQRAQRLLRRPVPRLPSRVLNRTPQVRRDARMRGRRNLQGRHAGIVPEQNRIAAKGEWPAGRRRAEKVPADDLVREREPRAMAARGAALRRLGAEAGAPLVAARGGEAAAARAAARPALRPGVRAAREARAEERELGGVGGRHRHAERRRRRRWRLPGHF